MRLVAAFYALSGIVTLTAAGSAFAPTAALSVGTAALLIVAAFYLERGSRAAACLLLAFFALGEAWARVVERRFSGPGIVFGLLVIAALANAGWGAVALHRARRAQPAPVDVVPELPGAIGE